MKRLKKPNGSKKKVFIKIIKINAINILYLNSPNIKKKPKLKITGEINKPKLVSRKIIFCLKDSLFNWIALSPIIKLKNVTSKPVKKLIKTELNKHFKKIYSKRIEVLSK